VETDAFMERDEAQLIRRAQNGDLTAFDLLVQRYDKPVLQLIYSMVNDVEDAKDVYQEVFMRAYRALPRFRFGSGFYTWLHRIAINACINYRRRRRTHYPLEESTDENTTWELLPASDGRNPEEASLNEELARTIDAAIDALPPKLRAVFVLRHYHGYKLSEIAAILKCSEGTVKSYLFRGTQRMRLALRPYVES